MKSFDGLVSLAEAYLLSSLFCLSSLGLYGAESGVHDLSTRLGRVPSLPVNSLAGRDQNPMRESCKCQRLGSDRFAASFSSETAIGASQLPNEISKQSASLPILLCACDTSF